MLATRLRGTLYEPVRPLWHVEPSWALFAGALTYNAEHSHSVAVYLCGLYAPFQLKLSGRRWLTCRTSVVPAGVPYALDVGGAPLAVLYLEPTLGRSDALRVLIEDPQWIGTVSLGHRVPSAVLRELYEDRDARHWIGDAINRLLHTSAQTPMRDVDLRICKAARHLSVCDGADAPVARLAQDAGLSVSRFQHLFTQEIGVPFRRYRCWQRLRAGLREVIGGANLTDAAHGAGFYDQAHFCRHFRATFGAAASPSLRRIRP